MVPQVVGKEKINDPSSVEAGDHICLWGTHNIFHHAIVTRTDGKRIEVIHHNTDRGYPKCTPKGGIFREWLDISKDSRILYKMVYDGVCKTATETIAEASRHVGERAYHLWSNNCEHFATLCKTGKAQCVQKWEFLKAMVWQGAKYVGSAITHTKKVVSEVKDGLVSACQGMKKYVNKVGWVMDAGEYGWSTAKACYSYSKGYISGFEVANVVTGKAVKIAVRAAVTTIVTGVGTSLAPGVGSYAGHAIGAVVGHMAGSACDWAWNKVTSWLGW